MTKYFKVTTQCSKTKPYKYTKRNHKLVWRLHALSSKSLIKQKHTILWTRLAWRSYHVQNALNGLHTHSKKLYNKEKD